MSRAKLLIYDDGRGLWGPLDHLRPIFEMRTGITTNRRRIERALDQPAEALAVAPRLAEAVKRRETAARVNVEGDDGVFLAVNGRWTGVGDPPPGAVQEVAGRDLPDFLKDPPIVDGPAVLSRPWHVLDQLETTFADDAKHWMAQPLAASANVHPSAVLDDSAGPVIVDEHAVIEPGAVVQGPAYVGPHTVVRALANVRGHTCLGPQCRVGGEVSFTIFQGYSNKAHLGFLGHALVGMWVNLGADTNCSNLKNTYGKVRVHLEKGRVPEDTGRIFMGPIIGDHVRTAIATRINTGSVLGTGSMIVLAGKFTPSHVPPLSYLLDTGRRQYDVDKLLATARIAMARRHVELDDAEADLLRALAGE